MAAKLCEKDKEFFAHEPNSWLDNIRSVFAEGTTWALPSDEFVSLLFSPSSFPFSRHSASSVTTDDAVEPIA